MFLHSISSVTNLKVFCRFQQGHCLISLATGKMDVLDAQRAGLVDCHAYAVLDLREVLVSRLDCLAAISRCCQ